MSTSTTDETTTSPTATTRRFPWWVRVLFTMIAMHVSMIPTLAVALVLQMTTASLDPTLQDWLGEIPSLLMPVGTLALLWVFMKYIDRRPMREAGLFIDRRTLPTFLLGFVLLTGLALAAIGLTHAAGYVYEPRVWGAGIALSLVDLFVRALVHASFCEELLFRGYLMQTLPQRNPWLVAFISAAAFGVLHLGSQGASGVERFAYFVGPTGWAFLAAVLVLVFRNLAPAVGVHFGSYVATDIASRLGWGEGPANWLAVGVVAGLAGAAILLWHTRRHPQVPQPLFAEA